MKKVIIIGGGFAGSTIAKKLENDFDVTLIDTKAYFEFTPGILRTIAHPSKERCMQYDHKKYLKNSEIIIGNVTEITGVFVNIGGKKISYDYLVIATGSSYNDPFKHPLLFVASRAKELSQYHHQLQKARNALIIGGGLVGVELAAEIAYYFPDVKLTIVNASDKLLDRMPEKAREYAREFFERHNVDMIFDEKVVGHKGKTFITDANTRIKADIAFNCVGITPNSDVVARKFSSKVDNRGYIKVDKYLRLEGSSNIFVAGDVAGIIEEKTAQNAEKQANIVAGNIRASENNSSLREYESKKRPIVLSLGPKDGLFIKNNFVLTGLLPAGMKWFVEKKEIWKKRL